MDHEEGCQCPECDPDSYDPRNIDPTIAYEDDPFGDEEPIEFTPDPDFFGEEDDDVPF